MSPHKKRGRYGRVDSNATALLTLDAMEANKSTTLSKSKDEVSPQVNNVKNTFRIEKNASSSTLARISARRGDNPNVGFVSRLHSSSE